MGILEEKQIDRDKELAKIIGMSVEEVQALVIACPDSIRISDGEKPDNLEDLYHDYEHLNFPAYLKTLMKTSATRRYPELFKLLRETKNQVCLDFGSGVGTHTIALKENINSVVALDVPGKLQEFTKQRLALRGYESTLCIANTTVLPDDAFSIVICSDCLEHVQSPLNELRRIYKSMKDGGLLHLLVSTMRKPSSGHFDSSIDEWLKYGKEFMKNNFTKIRPTIYRKD